MEQEQKLDENLVQVNVRLEKNLLKMIDVLFWSDRTKYISRERTIEYLIKKGMHQKF